jgi:hypothetical protein
MSTAMIAITTNSSINVNPGARPGFVTGLPMFLMATPAGKRVMEDGAPGGLTRIIHQGGFALDLV